MISKIFDSPKGQNTYSKRTICEVNREIYDLCVLGLHDKDNELLHKIVSLLEESYMMGVKMNVKLISHKDGNDEWSEDNVNKEQIAAVRQERIRLIELMKSQKKLIENHTSSKKKNAITNLNPVFILGTGRCGTSTLQRIFSSIKGVVSLHEGDFVDLFNHRKKKFPTLTGIENVHVQEGNMNLALRHIQSRVDYIKECQQNEQLYVESNPFIWPYIPAFRKHFPELRIIHAIRHPLTCINSLYGWPSVYRENNDSNYSKARKKFPDSWDRLHKICAFWEYLNLRVRDLEPNATMRLEDISINTIKSMLNKLEITTEFDHATVKKYNASNAQNKLVEQRDKIEKSINKWISKDTLRKFDY